MNLLTGCIEPTYTKTNLKKGLKMILENTFSFQWKGNEYTLRVKYVQKDTPWYLWIFGRRYQEGGYYVVTNAAAGTKYSSDTFIGSPNPVKAFEKAWEAALNLLDDYE